MLLCDPRHLRRKFLYFSIVLRESKEGKCEFFDTLKHERLFHLSFTPGVYWDRSKGGADYDNNPAAALYSGTGVDH